jgi:hypothetical protein
MRLLTRLAGGILDAAGFPAFSVVGAIVSIRMSVLRCGGNGRGHGVELAVGAFERGFLDMRRRPRAQVIGRLQAAFPGMAIERVEFFAARIGNVEIERLRLVDPLLPARRGVDQPA